MPSLSTVDDAARRRFNIVPFVHKPQQPDPNLSDKLKQEYPAILQWMIAGCIYWQKNGLVRPDVVSQATCEYFEDQDLLGKWLEEKCETGSGKHAKASELYKSWQDYAASNGEEPGSQKAFGSALAQRGYKKQKTCGVFQYHNIQLKQGLPFDIMEAPSKLSELL